MFTISIILGLVGNAGNCFGGLIASEGRQKWPRVLFTKEVSFNSGRIESKSFVAPKTIPRLAPGDYHQAALFFTVEKVLSKAS